MNEIINRVKEVLVSPKTIWTTIEAENQPHVKVLTSYVALLALIPAVCVFVGYGVIGNFVLGTRYASFSIGISTAVIQYLSIVGGAYIFALVLNLFATTFNATSDFDRAFSLVAYSFTPMFVAGVFYLIPGLRWIPSLAGLYGLYILYLGVKPMMKVPEEKSIVYLVVSVVVCGVIAAIISTILTFFIMGSLLSGLI